MRAREAREDKQRQEEHDVLLYVPSAVDKAAQSRNQLKDQTLVLGNYCRSNVGYDMEQAFVIFKAP